jgi:hypothetical protein
MLSTSFYCEKGYNGNRCPCSLLSCAINEERIIEETIIRFVNSDILFFWILKNALTKE